MLRAVRLDPSHRPPWAAARAAGPRELARDGVSPRGVAGQGHVWNSGATFVQYVWVRVLQHSVWIVPVLCTRSRGNGCTAAGRPARPLVRHAPCGASATVRAVIAWLAFRLVR